MFESTGGALSYAGVPVFEVVSVSPAETRMRFRLPPLKLSEVEVVGRNYCVVEAGGAYPTGIEGAPELPTYRCDFTIAPGRARSLAIMDSEVREIPCQPPIPSVGAVLRGEEPRVPVADASIYGGGGLYPEERLGEYGDYWLRGVPGVGVSVCPVQYDFARGMLVVAESLEFALRSDGATAADYAVLDSQVDFARMQASSFANGSLLGEVRGMALTPGHILLVVPESWQTGTNLFVEWKRRIGYEVTVAAYPLEDNADLGHYIAAMIADEGVSHVILCGDCGDVPPAYTSATPKSPSTKEPTSDIRYVLVSGDDYVPDAFISRVPSHDFTSLKGVLQKFIQYDSKPSEDDAWRGKAAFMASNGIANTPPYQGMIDYEIIAENYAILRQEGVLPEGCAEIYSKVGTDDSTLRAQLCTALNGGVAFMEYLGHGKNTEYTTSHFAVEQAKSLQNATAFPFIFAPVCDTGNFAYPDGDCLSEGFFLGAGNSFAINGAIGVLSATSETYWNPPIRSIYEFSDLLCNSYAESRLCTLGALSHRMVWEGAKLAESYTSDQRALYYTRQMHLLGDCSLLARLRSLRELEVTHRFVSPERLCVKVAWADDSAPVTGAFVVLSDQEGLRQAAICTDSEGEATMDCPIGSWRLFVNDASSRSVTLEIENEATDSAFRLPTLYVGLPATLSILPEDWAGSTVEYLSGLPDGMAISSDGCLSGVCMTAGEYEILVMCQHPEQGVTWMTLVLKVLSGVDGNDDGDVSTPELLEYLHACQYAEEVAEARTSAIALWENGSATRGEATCTEENPLDDSFREYSVALEKGVTEAFLSEAGAVVNGVAEGVAWIYADEASVARLLSANVSLMVPNDLAGDAKRLAVAGVTRSDAHYPSPEEALAEMAALVSSYPARCRMSYVGRSVQDREILALRISNLPEDGNAPQLLIAAAIHGNERTTMVMALNLARYLAEHGDELANALLDRVVFYIVPTMNPDGCAAVTRYNANGIDLNRGFPDGVQLDPLGVFAEGDAIRLANRAAEVQAFMRWCASHRFSAALHLHTGDQLVCYPYGNYKGNRSSRISPDNALFSLLSNRYAEQNPDINVVMNASDYYTVVGEVPDWQYRYLGTLAVTVEMTGSNAIGKEPQSTEELEALWEKNRPAFLAWAEAASTGISISVSSACDGAALPYATVQANYGQAVYCDANGQCHRTLTEGVYSVTVSAPGYVETTLDGIEVLPGESTSLEVALQPQTIGSRLCFSSLRSLPLVKGRMDVQVDSSSNEAVVVTVKYPDGWSGNLCHEADATRMEANGSCSYLFLDASVAEPSFALETDGVTSDEDVVSASTTWYVDASKGSRTTTLKRHWLCAEPRLAKFSLVSGWNWIGGTTAFALQDESIPLWGYVEGAYALQKRLLPGQGALLFSENVRMLSQEGWDCDEDLVSLRQGWNLKTALLKRGQVGPFYRFSEDTYIKTDTLLWGDVYWVYRKR